MIVCVMQIDRPKLYKSVNVFIFFVNVCFLLETSAPFCSEILLLENGNLSCSVLYSSTSFVVILGYMCCNDQLILLQGVSFLKPQYEGLSGCYFLPCQYHKALCFTPSFLVLLSQRVQLCSLFSHNPCQHYYFSLLKLLISTT